MDLEHLATNQGCCEFESRQGVMKKSCSISRSLIKNNRVEVDGVLIIFLNNRWKEDNITLRNGDYRALKI